MFSIFLLFLATFATYCLVCWIIGFILFSLGKVHPELALQSTVYAPLMPIAFALAFVKDEIIYGSKVWWYQRKAKWIAEELQKKGIQLHQFGIGDNFCNYDYNALHNACEVQADLKPDDVETYCEVYARAIKKFSWCLTPRKICSSAFPEQPLNKEWAQRNRVNEYFVEYFIPCINCDNKLRMGWQWGSDSFHSKLQGGTYSQVLSRTYTLTDGTRKTFNGFICVDCEKTLVGSWVDMSIGALCE